MAANRHFLIVDADGHVLEPRGPDRRPKGARA